MDISCLDPCKHLEFFRPLVIFVMKPPRLKCQTESRYVQTVPDGKCLCPDPPRRKMPMSRPSQTENAYV